MKMSSQGHLAPLCLTSFACLIVFLSCTPEVQIETRGDAPAKNERTGNGQRETTIDQSDKSLSIAGGLTLEQSCQAPFSDSLAFLVFDPMEGSSQSPVTCTGTVINGNAILTAAHCGGLTDFAGNGRFTVRCGCDTSTSVSQNFNPIIDLDDSSYALDAAVIEFDSLPASCKPIPLADHEFVTQPNQEVLVAGFGLQPDKGAGFLSMGPTTLGDRLENIEKGHGLGPRKRMVSLTERSGGIRTCFGDSGAPYLVETSGGFVQIGLHVAVVPATNKPCPDEARMLGHELRAILKWLRAKEFRYDEHQSDGHVIRIGPLEKASCGIRFESAGDPDVATFWELSDSLSQAACQVQCGMLGPTQFGYFPHATCVWKGLDGQRIGASALGIEGDCTKSTGIEEFIRLRFASSQMPCSVSIEIGQCQPNLSVYPVFPSSKSNQVACEGREVEPHLQMGCGYVSKDLQGEASWHYFPNQADDESCRKACVAHSEGVAPRAAYWCSMRGRVIDQAESQ